MFRYDRRRISRFGLPLAIALIAGLVWRPSDATAQVLVDNAFTHNYAGWVDAFPPPTRAGNWRLSLHNPTLMDTNNANPPNTGATANDGTYQPDVLIQNNFAAPANYDLSATLRTNDDDLFGLVWNFQDPNNYFRVGFRQQPGSGNFGGTEGVSVQKVVNGVITQLVPSTPMAGPAAVTQAMIENRTPLNVKVSVNGTNYEVFFNGASVASGSDADLASGRKVGVQSWAQQSDVGAPSMANPVPTPFWGTEVESVSVTQGANTLYSQSFAGRPVQWRQVVMRNQAGVTGADGNVTKEILGNFGLDIDNPWIYQQSNGFLNATSGNVDFIGPGVVVSDPGATSFTNYQMQVRMGAADNDGYGVLFRVQDDNNFYRIVFTNEGTGAGGTRAPRGMSVQKVRNGTWTELYRDDTSPLFVYTPAAAGTTPATSGFPMFDLSVGAVGNSFKIQVRDQNGNVINYPLITDSADPILSGTVGLTTWGTDNVYYMGYGGQNTPLLTTLSAFTDLDVVVNRTTGNVTLTNNGAAPIGIDGISIQSAGGALNPATWTPVANHYDEPPGNGSVDPNDPWTILSSTSMNLSEAEQSVGGDGGTLAVGQSINLGNAWVKSRIEDVAVDVQITNGGISTASVAFSGGPGGMSFNRSDLNTDGLVNASDWTLFYPNLLADMSSLTDVQQALAGDVDGDGDNDVNDFSLFKTDFDVANGAGAFHAMLANVPEPSSVLLLLAGIGGIICTRRRKSKLLGPALTVMVVAFLADSAAAVAVDFTTFSTEHYPHADNDADPATDFFPQAIWTVTPNSATHNTNADASVLYSPDSALNKRYIGSLTAGTDDDVVGFVLGFKPGDAQLFSSADYLLLDWKGIDQGFNFTDFGAANFHHDQTPTGPMPVGLALSRVTGSPTADELWQHVSYPENPSGGVQQLARAVTLGSTPYNRSGGSHVFDIRYTATNVTVLVDGVEQFDLDGSFPDGRFGVYTLAQGPPATFSSFEAVSTDFAGLSAVVDRSTGNITLRNTASASFELDYYEIDSASNSLNVAGWNSLSDQNFQSTGPGAHQKWQEAGGSDSSELAEAFLQSSTLAGNASISIGNAYNNAINGEDLMLTFRLPTGLRLQGAVSYVGTPPVGLAGDYNGNGRVDAADYVVWRKNPAGFGGNPAGYNTWRENFGKSAAGSGSALAGASSVPEPSSFSIALCIALFGVVKCMRQRGA
jgi:hypothetical protein